MTQEELFKKLVAHCKEYGFVFPSSEIYDGLGAVYDYGQNGVELKNNIKRYWWDSMVKLHENIVGLDAAIFMHPRTWEASGHVGAFNDPLIDNKDSKKRYRADVLIEDWLAKQDEKVEKEVEKARKRFGESFDEEKYRETSPRVAETLAKRDEVHKRFVAAQNANDLNELRQIIVDCEIVCPISGTRNWTEVRQFNLMFSTQMGSTSEGANTIYLRPETAQGIFVNFLNVQKTGRMKLPFGIAQIGKAFRNEIVARQFIFRMREFEQMEMQFFVRPGEEMKWWQQWKETQYGLAPCTGLRRRPLPFPRPRQTGALCQCRDRHRIQLPVRFQGGRGHPFAYGFRPGQPPEILGQEDPVFRPGNRRELRTLCRRDLDRCRPHVPAGNVGGLHRGAARWRRFARRAPFAGCAGAREGGRAAAGEEKDGMPEVAQRIVDDLKYDYNVVYDEKDSVGKRYRRQDAIGTPFCVTVDGQTLEDGTVTVRHRDTMEQERVMIESLPSLVEEECSYRKLFRKMNL